MRATTIAQEALQAGKLPPCPFPVAELSCSYRAPSLAEFKQVLEFEHLVKCIEAMYLRHEENINSVMASSSDEPPTDPHALKLWRQAFFRSMYRVFLAGGVLIGSYLGKSPANNFASCQEESVFGSFAESLYERSRMSAFQEERHLRVNNANRGGHPPLRAPLFTRPEILDPRARKIRDTFLDDVFQLLFGYTQLCGRANNQKILNGDGSGAYGRPQPVEENQAFYRGEVKLEGSTREVRVILLGVYQLEEISMPAYFEDAADMCLIANPAITHEIMEAPLEEQERKLVQNHTATMKRNDIPQILETAREISDQSDHSNDDHKFPQLFHYINRKYFNGDIQKRHFDFVLTSNYLPSSVSSIYPEL